MEMTVYNPKKRKLETLDIEINSKNTCYFEAGTEGGEGFQVTDIKQGLLVSQNDYSFPVLLYSHSGITRQSTAKEILRLVKKYQ